MGVGGQRHVPVTLLPGKRPGTHDTRGWFDAMAGLDGCGISRHHRDLIPGPSSMSLCLVINEQRDSCLHYVYSYFIIVYSFFFNYFFQLNLQFCLLFLPLLFFFLISSLLFLFLFFIEQVQDICSKL